MPASGAQLLKERLERALRLVQLVLLSGAIGAATGRGGPANRLQSLSEDPTADRSWLEISEEAGVRKQALGDLF